MGLLVIYLAVAGDLYCRYEVPKGVPRPVVKRMNWHPAAARAVEDIRSFPGALKMFKPLTWHRPL